MHILPWGAGPNRQAIILENKKGREFFLLLLQLSQLFFTHFIYLLMSRNNFLHNLGCPDFSTKEAGNESKQAKH